MLPEDDEVLDDDGCSAILRNGVYDKLQHEMDQDTTWDLREALREFDSGYSYQDYLNDWAKAHSDGRTESNEVSPSLSFKAITLGLDFKYGYSQYKMDRSDFELAKRKLLKQKHLLAASPGDRGFDRAWESRVASFVDSSVVQAWRDCKPFSQQGIQSRVSRERTGQLLQFHFRYVLGKGK
ncbi:unnamed protein product [Symbiodinium sp. CCMP2592]|nr:unnamed protein product [Symbiodinium sp. CCMP2592]